MKEWSVLELFSGIGGMHLALSSILGLRCKVICALDIHDGANQVYSENFPQTQVKNREICSLSVQEAKKLDCDLWTMSPPCQPFTSLGNQKAGQDVRCKALMHVMQLIAAVRPPLIFLENVKEFYRSDAWQAFHQNLVECDYEVEQFILTPLQFGIPNRRRRFYLVARNRATSTVITESIKINDDLDDNPHPHTELESVELPRFPSNCSCKICSPGTHQCRKIGEFLESGEFKLLPEEDKRRYFKALDMVNADEMVTDCFTKGYAKRYTGTGSFLQLGPNVYDKVYLDEIRQQNSPLDELMDSIQLRFFTSREIANLMCFPGDFKFPECKSEEQRIKLLGNSVNVLVVAHVMYWTFGKFTER